MLESGRKLIFDSPNTTAHCTRWQPSVFNIAAFYWPMIPLASGLLEIKHLTVLTVFFLTQRQISVDRYYSFTGLITTAKATSGEPSASLSFLCPLLYNLHITKHWTILFFVTYGPDICCPAGTVTSRHLNLHLTPPNKDFILVICWHIFNICYASHIMQISEHATN